MERKDAMKKLFCECAVSSEKTDIVNMRFNVEDRGLDEKEYSMCYDKRKPDLKMYCGPDWTFVNWPSANISSFERTVTEITARGELDPIIPKVGWFGNIRSPLRDVPEFQTRPLLKQIGGERPDLFDIINVEPKRGLVDERAPRYMSLPDLVQYKTLLDIGGNGYSGRLKYLMFSKRPLLVVDRHYVEYFHDDLIPYTHYIPVKMDLSDLVEKACWVNDNYEAATRIACNAFEFAVSRFGKDQLFERIVKVYVSVSSS
jgi:hypothetical protein